MRTDNPVAHMTQNIPSLAMNAIKATTSNNAAP
jgi:hypothetical protein